MAPHRSDFTFRTGMFDAEPPVRGGQPQRITAQRWHEVRVELTTASATYWVDGRTFATATLRPGDVAAEGFVGLLSYASAFDFRNLQVLPATAPAAPPAAAPAPPRDSGGGGLVRSLSRLFSGRRRDSAPPAAAPAPAPAPAPALPAAAPVVVEGTPVPIEGPLARLLAEEFGAEGAQALLVAARPAAVARFVHTIGAAVSSSAPDHEKHAWAQLELPSGWAAAYRGGSLAVRWKDQVRCLTPPTHNPRPTTHVHHDPGHRPSCGLGTTGVARS